MRKRGHRISDNVKAGLLRWWVVGMCYFMIAFGTQLGAHATPLDLIFFLGVGIGLATIVVYNPIAYGAFDIVRNGEIVNHARRSRSGAAKALSHLKEIGVSLLVVVLIYLVYEDINLFLVKALELAEDSVVVAGEPFGFASLYVLFYYAIQGVADKISLLKKSGKACSFTQAPVKTER